MDDLLSTQETAGMIGISVSCLLGLEKKGELLPHRRLPTGKRFYKNSDVDKFILRITKNNNA